MPEHHKEITPDQNRKLFDELKAQVRAEGSWFPDYSNAMQGDSLSFAVVCSYSEDDGKPSFYVTVDPFNLKVEKVEADFWKPGATKPTATFVGEEVRQLYLEAVLGRTPQKPEAEAEVRLDQVPLPPKPD